VVILAIPSFAVPQVTENELSTQGWTNGKTWELLDRQAKICYLTGIESGMSLFTYELLSRTNDIKEKFSNTKSAPFLVLPFLCTFLTVIVNYQS
jgi:hypothetical protein